MKMCCWTGEPSVRQSVRPAAIPIISLSISARDVACTHMTSRRIARPFKLFPLCLCVCVYVTLACFSSFYIPININVSLGFIFPFGIVGWNAWNSVSQSSHERDESPACWPKIFWIAANLPAAWLEAWEREKEKRTNEWTNDIWKMENTL